MKFQVTLKQGTNNIDIGADTRQYTGEDGRQPESHCAMASDCADGWRIGNLGGWVHGHSHACALLLLT